MHRVPHGFLFWVSGNAKFCQLADLPTYNSFCEYAKLRLTSITKELASLASCQVGKTQTPGRHMWKVFKRVIFKVQIVFILPFSRHILLCQFYSQPKTQTLVLLYQASVKAANQNSSNSTISIWHGGFGITFGDRFNLCPILRLSIDSSNFEAFYKRISTLGA